MFLEHLLKVRYICTFLQFSVLNGVYAVCWITFWIAQRAYILFAGQNWSFELPFFILNDVYAVCWSTFWIAERACFLCWSCPGGWCCHSICPQGHLQSTVRVSKIIKAIKVLQHNQSICAHLHKTSSKQSRYSKIIKVFLVLTSARDGSVVKDGEIIIGTRVALLQVEGHPGELDYVTWI